MHFEAVKAELGGRVQNRTLASLASAPNRFNTIRLIAAITVIFSHAFPITGSLEPLENFTGQASLGTLAVAAFFVISGFLIPASLDRGSITQYAIKRGFRIMPGLVVSVLVSAFVFGLSFTQLRTVEYLLHPQTWGFLGNGLFLPMGYDLPGVFELHPMRAVNSSLWSLKFEMACYAFVIVSFAVARLRRAAVIAAWLFSMAVAPMIADDAGGVWFYIDQATGLFRFFGMGMLFYLFADRIYIRRDWGWLTGALVVVSAFTPFFLEVAATAGAYAVITLAYCCGDRFRRATTRGDISYGVYVYAFPIQQSLLSVSLGFAMPWLANALLTLPLVMLAGLLSWLAVEKPALEFGRKAARGLGRTSVYPAAV